MKLEGSLDAFSLPDIFQLLSFTKKSGGLRLRHGGADGVVYFADGFVTGASADGVRQALARRLIGSGVARRRHARHARSPRSRPARASVRWLVDNGVVDRRARPAGRHRADHGLGLRPAALAGRRLRVQRRRSATPTTSASGSPPTSSSPRRAQRQAAWDAVAAVIPGPDAVLTMPVVLAGEPTVTRDEWALLALVDGRRRVGDLVELTGCGQFAVVSTLAALVGRGLLQVSDTARPRGRRSRAGRPCSPRSRDAAAARPPCLTRRTGRPSR